MVPLKVTIHRVGSGHCSLTRKDADGLCVSFDDGTVKESFLSWRGFRQLLSMKAGTSKSQVTPTTIDANSSSGSGK
jgi:hypothetical protein